MNEEESKELFEALKEFYGDRLANYEFEPLKFKHQVELYNYAKSKIEQKQDK